MIAHCRRTFENRSQRIVMPAQVENSLDDYHRAEQWRSRGWAGHAYTLYARSRRPARALHDEIALKRIHHGMGLCCKSLGSRARWLGMNNRAEKHYLKARYWYIVAQEISGAPADNARIMRDEAEALSCLSMLAGDESEAKLYFAAALKKLRESIYAGQGMLPPIEQLISRVFVARAQLRYGAGWDRSDLVQQAARGLLPARSRLAGMRPRNRHYELTAALIAARQELLADNRAALRAVIAEARQHIAAGGGGWPHRVLLWALAAAARLPARQRHRLALRLL